MSKPWEWDRPGLEDAINYNLALINVGKVLLVWDGGIHRSRELGAASITLYDARFASGHSGRGCIFQISGQLWFEARMKLFSNLHGTVMN
jgi:hypothetical protein